MTDHTQYSATHRMIRDHIRKLVVDNVIDENPRLVDDIAKLLTIRVLRSAIRMLQLEIRSIIQENNNE